MRIGYNTNNNTTLIILQRKTEYYAEGKEEHTEHTECMSESIITMTGPRQDQNKMASWLALCKEQLEHTEN